MTNMELPKNDKSNDCIFTIKMHHALTKLTAIFVILSNILKELGFFTILVRSESQ